jgi:hypothetical protein
MKIHRKNLGLLLVSLIALSFNSQFAQAAKKTADMLRPGKVYAFKRAGDAYSPIKEVQASPLVVKKTGVQVDRNNLYIGGYVINSSKTSAAHVRIFPTFKTQFPKANTMTDLLNHDVLNLAAGEVRRFVIMRPIQSVKELLENNIPLSENCILNCRML